MSRSINTNIVTLSGFFHGDTGKATLFEVHEVDGEPVADPKKEWFPLSQVSKMIKQPAGSQEFDTLVAAEWFCKKKDLV